MPDRFSDGKEDHRPLFNLTNPTQYKHPDKGAWMNAGKFFQGGKINGITKKLDYLKQLGVTAIWVAPVFQQRKDLNDSYHGYGIQNFLDVDPRFGTIEDLKELVNQAHNRKMYVIFDIIYNHTGNNWFYNKDGQPVAELPYRYQPEYQFYSWRSGDGTPTNQISGDYAAAVWPQEFQNIEWYTRAGKIERWDPDRSWENPMDPRCQFRRGDFFALKDLDYSHEEVLTSIIRIYQYWIALTDCDGFRIDTVKHLPWDVSRNFCGAIHEFAESIGKENFLLVGEVTGGDEMLKNYLDIFGRNIDAGLDIGIPAKRLENMVKGKWGAEAFFDQFGTKDILGSHRETGRYHVSILDDHDAVGRRKSRFSAHNEIDNRYQQVAHAVGVQLTTLGIPCIYYGTEQAFDGTCDRHDANIEPLNEAGNIPYDDRYIRESMFGGTFGAFETKDCHFFNSEHPAYIRISAIAQIRQRNDKIGLALRRGRQYLRETSFWGSSFAFPGAGELVAWSRILVDKEVVVALNTNGVEARGAEITIHTPFYNQNSVLNIFYRSDWKDNELKEIPDHPLQTLPVKKYENGRTTVRVDLPPAGMIILSQI
ncbi:MAG: alpha-amlyase [Firmicutes bacterium]|nr:alpha-amlyase [Bacillota bacterium]